MLNRDQIELIHREIDGANTSQESAAFRSLMEEDAEARALEADLRNVTQLFDRAGEREPPPRLKQAILEALPQRARVPSGTEAGWITPGATVRWLVHQLKLASDRMEEAIVTRKAMLVGGTALAAVIVVAGIVTGFPPGRHEAGTIGGVEQAARYQGRSMTAADVTLKNPEIQALFQNDQILRLVQSDAFRDMMQNQAFRDLMASQAYREVVASQAYRDVVASQAYREVVASQAYREIVASQAYREIAASQAYREIARSWSRPNRSSNPGRSGSPSRRSSRS